MALLFSWLPIIILLAMLFYTYQWGDKFVQAPEDATDEVKKAVRSKFYKGLLLRAGLSLVLFFIATSVNTNYGPRFKAEPRPVAASTFETVDKNGDVPVIRDVERDTRHTPEEAEKRTRETLDWRAAHAKRDAELAQQAAPAPVVVDPKVTPAPIVIDPNVVQTLEKQADAFSSASPLESANVKP